MNECLLDNHIKINEKIGYGNFSKIYTGYHCKNKIKIAIKKMKSTNGKEVSIMKKLQHNNILKLYNSIYKHNYIYLILELCKYDLSTYIRHNIKLSENDSQEIFKQIVSGVKYLYENHIVHRDLKPHNILLTQDNIVKICDFGFSCYCDDIDSEICGSPFYMAPEMLKKQKYTNKIDLWSLGIILFQMLEGKVPFSSNTIRDLITELDIIHFSSLISYHISYNCRDLILKLLNIDPDKRISWEDLFHHNWIKNNTLPIDIPNKEKNIEEPIFNNNFHCFSDEGDYLIINSPPQNDIDNDYKEPNYNLYNNFKKTFRYFSI